MTFPDISLNDNWYDGATDSVHLNGDSNTLLGSYGDFGFVFKWLRREGRVRRLKIVEVIRLFIARTDDAIAELVWSNA